MEEPKSPEHKKAYESWKALRKIEGKIEFKAPDVLEREKEFGPTLYFIREAHGGVMPEGQDKSTGFTAAELAAGHLLAVNDIKLEDLDVEEAPKSLAKLVHKFSDLVPPYVLHHVDVVKDFPDYEELKGEHDHMQSITHERDILRHAVGYLYLAVIDNWKNGKTARGYLNTYHDYMHTQK